MKVFISYPPLESEKGVPLLGQNRQFQWFNDPTYIYPMVPAYGATMLKKAGFDVIWDDAIAEGLDYFRWLERVEREGPDVIVMETKTPVVKRHWRIVKDLKERFDVKVVLVGDHVTALPEESMENSPVDFILAGGDHDFLLKNLMENMDIHGHVETEKLEQGIWYRENGVIRNTGQPRLDHDLESMPFIDRELTRWRLYSMKNGNFKHRPGTYTMAGRDCWWGRCTFCSWTTMYPGKNFRVVSPERLLDEVGRLIKDLDVREVFDDSGTFPCGRWLEEFCRGMVRRGYNRKILMGCNMRINALDKEDYRMMARAGFRFVLFGLESVNQKTLDRLNKGLSVDEIKRCFRMAKEAGLEPHVTVMVGYPWEGREEAEETITFAREVFQKGYVDSLQATIVIPYPGTPLYKEAKEKGWLLTEDWDSYDMRESVWRSPVNAEDVKDFARELYRAAFSPAFIMRKLFSIRNLDDIRYLLTAGKKVMAHLADFGKREGSVEKTSKKEERNCL